MGLSCEGDIGDRIATNVRRRASASRRTARALRRADRGARRRERARCEGGSRGPFGSREKRAAPKARSNAHCGRNRAPRSHTSGFAARAAAPRCAPLPRRPGLHSGRGHLVSSRRASFVPREPPHARPSQQPLGSRATAVYGAARAARAAIVQASLRRIGHPTEVGLARVSRRRPDCPLPLLILCPMVRGRAHLGCVRRCFLGRYCVGVRDRDTICEHQRIEERVPVARRSVVRRRHRVAPLRERTVAQIGFTALLERCACRRRRELDVRRDEAPSNRAPERNECCYSVHDNRPSASESIAFCPRICGKHLGNVETSIHGRGINVIPREIRGWSI